MIRPLNDEPDTERRIIRYVLGELVSPELDEVEDRLLADQAFFEQVEAVEAEVCDDFVAGRLSPAEQSAFAARLAESPRLQRRVAFARSLAAGSPPAPRMAPWWWAAAAAVILATAGALWLGRDRTPPSSTNASGPGPGAAPPPQVILTPAAGAGAPRVTPPVPPVLATITLFGPVVRDAGELPVLSIPAGDGLVRVQVALQDADVFPAYRAEITSRAGAAVFAADRLAPSTASPGRTVAMELAADRLPTGTYQIHVYGVRASAATRLVTYGFRVNR